MKTETKSKPLRFLQNLVAADVSQLRLFSHKPRADSGRLLLFSGLSPGLLRAILTLSLLASLLPARAQDPKITNLIHPMDTNVSVGASVRFQVYAISSYNPLKYQWQHDGADLAGATNAILTLTNVTVADGGGYVARVTNSIGGFTNSRTAMLTVDATFTQITTGALATNTIQAWNLCWVDYDGDGFVDFYAVPGGSQAALPSLYHNEGNGTFRKVTTNLVAQTPVFAFAFVWADYDNDGYPDLFVPNNGTMNDMLFHNNGNGTFTRIMAGHPVSDGVNSRAAVWLDYDQDGFLDLFVTTGGCPGQDDILYRNNGDGTFRRMTAGEVGPIVSDGAKGDYVVWADVDGDGSPELSRTISPACVTAPWTNEVWHVDSQGKFFLMDIGEVKEGIAGFTIATWADYDNDGLHDAMVYVENEPIRFYRNLAGQGFSNIAASAFTTPLTNYYPWYVGDYDNDGWQDIVALDAGNRNLPFVLLRNNADGTYTRQYVGTLTSIGQGWAIFGDYTNDGFFDAYLAVGTGVSHLLMQHNGNANHWLKVKLDGRASNRSGIGAKVRVQATIGGRTFWQMREISGQGVGLENGLLAHFGLGDATNITTLRIEWPSGIAQEIPNVAANQFLTVVESQGYTNTPPAFASAVKDTNGLQFAITEPVAGARYILEASADMVTWTKLLARTSTGGTHQFTDTQSASYPQRFYRLQVP